MEKLTKFSSTSFLSLVLGTWDILIPEQVEKSLQMNQLH